MHSSWARINKCKKNPWVVYAGLQEGGIQQNRSACWKRHLGEDYHAGLFGMNFPYAHPEGLVTQARQWHKLGTVIECRKQRPTPTSSNFRYTSHSTLSLCISFAHTLTLTQWTMLQRVAHQHNLRWKGNAVWLIFALLIWVSNLQYIRYHWQSYAWIT